MQQDNDVELSSLEMGMHVISLSFTFLKMTVQTSPEVSFFGPNPQSIFSIAISSNGYWTG